jgi:small conductance mechanosensitive channel
MNDGLITKITLILIYILSAILLYLLFNVFLKKILKKDQKKRLTVINLIKNILKYLLAIIVIVLILEEFNIDTKSIMASLGIAGLIIGLAVQDLIKDFIAGTFIIFDDVYNIGDVVTINNFKGEVINVGLKTTRIKSFKGDVLAIANGKIDSIINHSLESSLAVVDINVPFETDINKVIALISKNQQLIEEQLENIAGNLEVLGVQDIGTNGLIVRVVIKTLPEKHYNVERKLKQLLKELLEKNKISIPYQRLVISNERI